MKLNTVFIALKIDQLFECIQLERYKYALDQQTDSMS